MNVKLYPQKDFKDVEILEVCICPKSFVFLNFCLKIDTSMFFNIFYLHSISTLGKFIYGCSKSVRLPKP